MRRFLLPICSFFIIALTYGIVISQFRPLILSDDLTIENAEGYYDYKGVTNAHTSLNKGSLPPEDVIKEAQKARLDFLFLTDLNVFTPSPIQEAYFDNTLVIPANTYSYLDAHFVYYSSDQTFNFSGLGDVQMFFSDQFSQKNEPDQSQFTVLAHPFKGGRNWKADLPPAVQGIEIINLKSVWRDAWRDTKVSFIWSMLIYPFNSHLALLRLFHAPDEEVEYWDELNTKRPTIGLVGNETTSRKIPIGRNLLRFPSYQTSFEIASNHVLLRSELTGDVERDRQKIVRALSKGQFYMSLDYLQDPKGFVTSIVSGKKEFPTGSLIKLKKGMQLSVRLPKRPLVPFEVIIYRGAKPIHRSHKKNTLFPIAKAGVYRVVVRVIPTLPIPDGKKWIPWIYSNPFFVNP